MPRKLIIGAGLALLMVLFAVFSTTIAARIVRADDETPIEQAVVPYLDIIMTNGASVAGISQDTLATVLATGKTLGQVGAEAALPGDFGQAFLEACLSDVDGRVAAGNLDPEDAQAARDLLKTRIDEILNTPHINDSGANAAPASAAAAAQGVPSRRLNVVSTTVQITALTQAVAGNLATVRGIIPAGADPHEFEPVPSDLVAIESADLILRHGLGLDDWLDDTLKAGASANVETVTSGVRLLQGSEDGKRIVDPHVWHDPENAKIMADNIAAALAALDPGDAGAFAANAEAQKRRLDDAKSEGLRLVRSLAGDNRKLVTDHDAFQYFARAFGFRIVGFIFPVVDTSSEPSARDIAMLLDKIREEHVKAVFAEGSINPRLAKSVASDAGVKIVSNLYGDSMGQTGSGADTVEGIILANIRSIVSALQ